MNVSGSNLPSRVVEAAQFYGRRLMDGRVSRHVHVEIVLTKKIAWAGLCAPDEDRVKPKYFTITLNTSCPDVLQTLAHEMCHVKQYATGELQDCMDGVVVWKGETFHGQSPYAAKTTHDDDAPPWEQEAYGMEEELFEQFLRNGIHSRA